MRAEIGASEPRSQWSRELLAIALLIVITAFQLGPGAWRLGLLHDDWPHFYDIANGHQPAIEAGAIRPLHTVPWKVAGRWLGLRLPGYYLLLAAANVLFGVLLYLLARRFSGVLSALAFAALVTLWPADASRLWLSSIGLRTAFVIALLALLIGEWSRQRNSRTGVVCAVLVGLISLLFYELHFFILAGWPLFARGLGRPWPRKLSRIWILLPAAYLAWRFGFRPLAGAAAVQATWNLDPVVLAERAFLRLPFNLFLEGWSIAAAKILQAPVAAIAWFVLLAGAGYWLVGSEPEPPPAARPEPVSNRRWLAVGAALLAAGALPILPTDYWFGRAAGTFAGRILAAAIPGAVVSALAIVGRIGSRFRTALVVALALTFAAAFHSEIRAQASANWQTQLAVRQRISEQFPVWPPGTFLVVRGLPPNRLGYETPFGFGRGLTAAYPGAGLSAIGFGEDRKLRDFLACELDILGVFGGSWGRVPLERAVLIDWGAGEPRLADPSALAALCARTGLE